MNVRTATRADLDALAELWDEFSGGDFPSWVPDARGGSLAGIARSVEWGAAAVAEDGGRVVGMAAALPHGPGAAELTELYVRPGARRRGAASALVREVAAALRREGVELVFVATGTDNAVAQAVYARWRFRPHMVELVTELAELERGLGGARGPGGGDLAFAHALADEADAITLARFRAADLHVDTKPDLTPVSEADLEVESRLRARVAAERPGDAFLGEEHDFVSEQHKVASGSSTGARWVVDPIDATRNYVRGIPVWATLIALEDRAAVVSAPALGRRWWASRGDGAWTRDADGSERRLRVSAVERLEDATLAYTSLTGWGPPFHRLAERVSVARGYGDFWGYMLLAEGAVDACVEAAAAHWDLAAPLLVVEEAGGRLTDLAGEPRADCGNAVATNGLLHDDVLAALAAD